MSFKEKLIKLSLISYRILNKTLITIKLSEIQFIVQNFLITTPTLNDHFVLPERSLPAEGEVGQHFDAVFVVQGPTVCAVVNPVRVPIRISFYVRDDFFWWIGIACCITYIIF